MKKWAVASGVKRACRSVGLSVSKVESNRFKVRVALERILLECAKGNPPDVFVLKPSDEGDPSKATGDGAFFSAPEPGEVDH